MKKVNFLVLVTIFLSLSPLVYAKRKVAASTNEPNYVVPTIPTPLIPKIEPVQTLQSSMETKFYRYRLNTLFGLNVFHGSAVLSGTQFAYAIFHKTPLFIGPELSFSLFSPASILTPMMGAWYEFAISGESRVSLSTGVVAGPAFTSGITNIPATSLATYFDLALLQEIDDLVTIRAQLRPGFIHRDFSMIVNFSIGFRFI